MVCNLYTIMYAVAGGMNIKKSAWGIIVKAADSREIRRNGGGASLAR